MSSALSPQQSNLIVTQLFVHPIKSCRGTSVQEANYTIHGLENDRTFVLIDANTRKVVTARDFTQMVLITPNVVGDQLVISFPDGSDSPTFNVPLRPSKDVTDQWELIPDLNLWGNSLDGYVVQFSPESPYKESSPSEVISKYLSHPVQLIFEGPTRRVVESTESHPTLSESSTAVYQDNYPLLIISEESFSQLQENTLKAVNEETGWTGVGGLDKEKWRSGKLQIERFRPNIVVTGATEPFEEDRWNELQFGKHEAPVLVVSRASRCRFPNIDPNTAEKDTAVPYKVLSKYRRVDPAEPYSPCFGANASPKGSGVIKVGDSIAVLSWFNRTTLPTAKDQELAL